ncbi:MAG: hypothetical protein J6S75_04030 [Thermoguttaceae bacterium]|nr:hypothetical protein [Thermoguttaceae bacterium]
MKKFFSRPDFTRFDRAASAGGLVLTGDTFSGNTATKTGFGGAVNTWAGGTITDCRFTGNSAKYDAAVSALGNDAAATITDTSFSQNNAASFGGAIYASGTVVIDGAAISDNIATLGGGVFAITSDISATQKGRGKVTFTGDATVFSGNISRRTKSGQRVGNDICATSSSNADGGGAVFEIKTMPTFGDTDGYAVGIDRSIIVLAEGLTLDPSMIYSNKETTCGYTYSGGTLSFTSLTSHSGIDRWRIYWSGSATGESTEYAGTGALPSGEVAEGTTVLIKGYKDGGETIYYMIPTAGGSGASEALFDDALLDDAELFEGLGQEGSALEEYCDECFL